LGVFGKSKYLVVEAREENLAAQIGEGGTDAGGGVWVKAWVAGRKRAQHCRGEAPYYFGEMRVWLNSQSRASEAAYYTGAGTVVVVVDEGHRQLDAVWYFANL
jgi:hypothetical protein